MVSGKTSVNSIWSSDDGSKFTHLVFFFWGGGAIRRNPITRQNWWQSMEVMTKCLATRSNPLQKKTKQGYHVINSHTLNPKP